MRRSKGTREDGDVHSVAIRGLRGTYGGSGETRVRWSTVEPLLARMSVRRAVIRFLVYAVILLGAAILMVPFLWMLSTALKSLQDVFSFPPKWIPDPIIWRNFYDALTWLPFGLFALNTILVTGLCVLGEVLSCSAAGYSFARLHFPGRDKCFLLVISTMMLPYPVLMIPNFILFKYLGWIDTFLPLVVPSFLGGSAFSIFLFRQFFRSIPRELDDAARVDGCGPWGIFWRVTIHLSKPVFGAVAIFSFVSHWNRFIGPLIYLNSMKKYTLALGLSMYRGQTGVQWNWLMAASFAVMLPCLLLFFFFQRIFIQGVVFTGVKG